MSELYEQIPLTESDIITSDGYWQTFPQHYYKTDCLHFDRGVLLHNSLILPPAHSGGGKLMIAGHSDYPIDDEIINRYMPRTMWCINKQTTKPNVFSLPLGITNHSFEMENHPYGNLSIMLEVRQEPRVRKNLCYMNFSIWTYPQERQRVWELLCGKEWVTVGEQLHDLEGRKQFLRDLKSHPFVLCPRGNGLDTHRLWEALYMGSIPVVRRDIGYNDFTELPICWVNDWTDVTPEFLEYELERIKSGRFDMNRLKLSYWIERIRETL